MFYLVTFALLLSCIYGAILEYNNKSPVITFYVSIILIFIIPIFFDYNLNEIYPSWVYMYGSSYSLLFIISFLLSRNVLSRMSESGSVWRRSVFNPDGFSNEATNIPLILSVISGLGFVFSLQLFSLDAMRRLNWWDLVQSGSFYTIASTHIAYASAALLVATAYRQSKGKSYISGYIVGALWILFSVFVLKTRSYLLINIIPFSLLLLYNQKYSMKIFSIIGSALAAGLFVLTRAVRHAGDLNSFLEGDMRGFIESATMGSENVLYQSFLYFIYHGNNFPGFGENNTLMRIVFFWIPSQLLDVKPVDFSYVMHDAFFGYSVTKNLSLHPTIFGDAYANYGIFGAFIYSFLLAFVISIVEYMANRSSYFIFKMTCFSVVGVSCLVFSRGAMYNGFMFTVIPITLFYIILKCKTYLGRDKVRYNPASRHFDYHA